MMHARASCKQGRRLMNGTIFSVVWTTDSIPNFHMIDRSLGLPWLTSKRFLAIGYMKLSLSDLYLPAFLILLESTKTALRR